MSRYLSDLNLNTNPPSLTLISQHLNTRIYRGSGHAKDQIKFGNSYLKRWQVVLVVLACILISLTIGCCGFRVWQKRRTARGVGEEHRSVWRWYVDSLKGGWDEVRVLVEWGIGVEGGHGTRLYCITDACILLSKMTLMAISEMVAKKFKSIQPSRFAPDDSISRCRYTS
jgi:hypothetical protein